MSSPSSPSTESLAQVGGLSPDFLLHFFADPTISTALAAGGLIGHWKLGLGHPRDAWFSPSFKTLLGYADKDCADSYEWLASHVVSPERHAFAEHLARCSQHPAAWHELAISYRHRNGSILTYQLRTIALVNTDGQPSQVLGTHTLARVEAVGPSSIPPTLAPDRANPGQPSEFFAASFARAVETTSDAVIICSNDGRINYCNPAAERLYGYERKDFLAGNIEMLDAADDRSAIKRKLKRCQQGDEIPRLDALRLRKDGSSVNVSSSMFAVPSTFASPSEIVDMSRSIEELVRSEARWREVVEGAPHAIVVVDAQRRIVMANRKTVDLFGYERELLIGNTIEMLVPHRVRDRHPDLVAGFFASPQMRAMGGLGAELFGCRRDGSEVPVEIGLNPIRTDDGSFVVASIIDISARKRSESRFRAVVEAAPNAMILVGPDRRIRLVNRQAEALFCYDRREMIGILLEELIPERSRERHPIDVERYMANPQSRPMGAGRDLFGRRKDGSEVALEIGLNPIEWEEGTWVLASIINISERRNTERLREELAAIVVSSEDAIVSASLDGIATSWNRGAHNLFGIPAERAIGKPIANVMRLVDGPHFESQVQIVQESGSVIRYETQGKLADSSAVELAMTLSPIRDRGDSVTAIACICRDITEQKEQYTELTRSNAELEKFACVASHDLQEPLRTVANYTELLASRYREKLDERGQLYMHYIVDGAHRMQQLVRDLLAYARVGSQGKPLTNVSTSVVVLDVLDRFRDKITAIGAVINLGTLPQVLGDEVQVGQLFQNLVGNALKFRSDKRLCIDIGAVPDDDSWHFCVADNGIGIDMDYANRIFEMFQRLHDRGEYDGSGIGLAISKRIVERHGGRIWVDSATGVGSKFHFTLKSVPMEMP